jgi:peptidoglycan-N-acetylglucosamine deacetylase
MTRAHWTALGAGLGGGILAVLGSPWAVLPPAVFVMLCLIAPFFPRGQFFLPLVNHGPREVSEVALTFDDGPSPELTPCVLDLLARHEVPATFFVIGARAQQHPDLLQAILAAGHEVGNHSMHHDPLLMLRGRRRLRSEVAQTQGVLAAAGLRVAAFRPPAGITNPRLGPVLRELGLYGVGFSRRGNDWGNRRVKGLARRILRGVRGGDVILLHDSAETLDEAGRKLFLGELEKVLNGLGQRGLRVVPLSRLVGRMVSEAAARSDTTAPGSDAGPPRGNGRTPEPTP